MYNIEDFVLSANGIFQYGVNSLQKYCFFNLYAGNIFESLTKNTQLTQPQIISRIWC